MPIKVKHSSHKIRYPNPTRPKKRKFRDPYRFYVYMWLRSKDSITGKAGTPYYVGKGFANRAYRKGGPIDKSNIVIVESNMLEEDAFELEIKLIIIYGRKDLKTGILINFTDGGEGVSGIVRSVEWGISKSESMSGDKNHNYGRKKSPETIEKMRKAQTGKKHTPENIEKNRIGQTGRKHSAEQNEKFSKSMTGKKRTPEQNKARSIAMTGRKHTPEQIEKNRKAQTGRKQSPETIEKRRIATTGLKRTPEQNKATGDRLRGKQHKLEMCCHCGLVGGISAIRGYHSNKCKYHPDRVFNLLKSVENKCKIKYSNAYNNEVNKIRSIIVFQQMIYNLIKI